MQRYLKGDKHKNNIQYPSSVDPGWGMTRGREKGRHTGRREERGCKGEGVTCRAENGQGRKKGGKQGEEKSGNWRRNGV